MMQSMEFNISHFGRVLRCLYLNSNPARNGFDQTYISDETINEAKAYLIEHGSIDFDRLGTRHIFKAIILLPARGDGRTQCSIDVKWWFNHSDTQLNNLKGLLNELRDSLDVSS